MELTLAEAATQAHVSKSTLLRGIRRGRISAQRCDDGSFLIDASEVARAFPETRLTREKARGTLQPSQENGAAGAADAVETRVHVATLEAQVMALREMLQELRSDRDAWRSTAERLLIAAPPVIVTPTAAPAPAPAAPTPAPARAWWRWWGIRQAS